MKHFNDLGTTVSKMELSHRTDHFVIGVDNDYILEGHFDTIEAAHAKVVDMMTTGDHHTLDIESRDVNGETLEVYTVYENEEDDDDEEESTHSTGNPACPALYGGICPQGHEYGDKEISDEL